METIKIKKITLKNFGGVASGERVFSDEPVHFIEAEFGSGKSSFYHAYQWALGLNVPFEPNIAGNKIKGVETEVIVTLSKGLVEKEFRRIAKQCWKSDILGANGEATERFDKYSYLYFVDGIEFKSKAYAQMVLSYFNISGETEINILADTQYFNGNAEPKWNAEKRRAFLFGVFGIAEKTRELAKTYPLIYSDLYETGVSQETLRKDIKRKRDEIKNQIEFNRGAVAELIKEKSTLSIDYEYVGRQIEECQYKLNELETAKSRAESTDTDQLLQAKIADLQSQIRGKEKEYAEKLHDNEMDVASAQQELLFWGNRKHAREDILRTIDSEWEEYNIDETELGNTAFSDADCRCPTCGRKLAESALKKKKEAFEQKKAEKLADIASARLENRRRRAEMGKALNDIDDNLQAAQAKLKALQGNAPIPPDTSELAKEIAKLSEQLGKKDKKSFDAEIAEAKTEFANLMLTYASKKRLEEVNNRITQLQQTIMNLANSDMELVRKAKELDEFSVKEIQLASETVNAAFGGRVKFNFFEELGGTTDKGFKKTCIAAMDGIAYPNLSGGQQILCDYLVNSALRKILGWKAPLWVDELCRITNDVALIEKLVADTPTDNQCICLVTKDDAKLPIALVKDVYNK